MEAMLRPVGIIEPDFKAIQGYIENGTYPERHDKNK